MPEKDDTLVLVTGASGYIAGHCVKTLLEDGYRVRGTVRSLTNRAKVSHLERLAEQNDGRLELVCADLVADDGWDEAVAGATYVLHVASPFPANIPKDEMELIGPAVDGTRRVLAACERTAGGVKRVVLTSSIAAIAFGHSDRGDRTFTEEDWSVPDQCDPYQKSKTLAERAAWDFVAALPAERRFEMTVINPGFVLGPMMSDVGGTSAELIRRLLGRKMPACPELGWAVVDVRDLARAHVLAMTTPAASNNRYICAGENVWLRDMARALDSEFRPMGYRVPTGHLPYWMLWLVARFDKTIRLTLSYVGKPEHIDNSKVRRDLGWEPRDPVATVVDMGHSAIELGMV